MHERTRIGHYLEVERLPERHGYKTRAWNVVSISSGDYLGNIMWFGRWRQYTFNPAVMSTFNHSCLLEISDFLKKCNREHRQGKHNA